MIDELLIQIPSEKQHCGCMIVIISADAAVSRPCQLQHWIYGQSLIPRGSVQVILVIRWLVMSLDPSVQLPTASPVPQVFHELKVIFDTEFLFTCAL